MDQQTNTKMRQEYRAKFGRGSIDFDGLTGFVLAMLGILALLLWLLYKFALLVFPAFALAVAFLAFLFVPFHLASSATVQSRSSHRISQLLAEIRTLESSNAPREQCWVLETRVKESAQAQVNSLWEEQGRLHARPQDPATRDALRTVTRQMDELRCRFGVFPETERSERFVRLHMENDTIRALVKNPRMALGLTFITLACLTTVMTAVINFTLELFGLSGGTP